VNALWNSSPAARIWLPRLAWLAAGWPVISWWLRRADQTDDALAGLAAVAGAAAVALARRKQTHEHAGGWLAAGTAISVYLALAAAHMPATILGFPLLAGLLLTPGPWRRGRWPDPAVAGLLVLGLPTTMMLELYLGYPLRLAASMAAARLLAAAGVPILRDGVLLALPGAPVWVDAPCSGVRMLWGGAWLALALSGLAGLGWRRTLAAGVWALAWVTLANAMRVTGLVLAAAGLLPSGKVFHAGIGIASFLCGALAIAASVRLLRRSPQPAAPAANNVYDTPWRARYLLLCAAAACIPLLGADKTEPAAEPPFPGWPATFEGAPLVPGKLSKDEAAFAGRFPGRVGRFTCGDRTVIVRWVTRPTHRVHGAADCLRSSGWRITPMPLIASPDGAWSAFQAQRHGVVLNVRERCEDGAGNTWPDLPSWFWSAIRGRHAGPWNVVTVVEREG